MSHYSPDPLIVMRLRGSQTQMGAQQGTLLRELGGFEHTRDFYPEMASAMLGLGVPRQVRRLARRIFSATVDVNTRRLHRTRQRLYPHYVARTEAMMKAVGAPDRLVRAIAVMDVLQNTVGALGRHGLLQSTGLHVAAVPACTSLAVWGESSSDGRLRHARNFDFPGAGVWDRAPAVVLCDPDQGLRYGFVTTRGADTPGVTAFNEAGLSLTAHTRFHRDVRYDAAGVIDFGHELVRTCRNLDDVRRLAGRTRTASTWGFLVSSASEQRAMVVETTGSGTAFIEPRAGVSHLATTNRYLDAGLAHGELTTSDTFVVDSNSRWRRADGAVARCGGQMSRDDLERLLADRGDPEAPDPEADDRLVGNCIATAMTVKSVVLEPEDARVRMSVGPAPTGGGPWVDVPYAWDGEVGLVPAPVATEPRDDASTADRVAVGHYVTASRRHLAGEPPQRVRDSLEQGVAASPREPNLRFLAAMFAIVTGDFEAAERHLAVARQREHGVYRRGLVLAWHARTLAALGRHEAARDAWRELEGLPPHESLRALVAAASRERSRPLSRMRLRTVVPDVFLVDGTLPGR